MCEPITLTAITTSVTASIASAASASAAAAATAASAVASAAATAASAVGSAISTVGAALSIGGGAGGAGGGAGALGGSFGAAITPGVTTGIPAALPGLLPASAILAESAPLLTIPNVVAAVGLVGGAVSATVTGVQQTEGQKETVKAAEKDAALKRIATLQGAQQTAEATAQQQFEAQRSALAAKGVIKASNLGDRSVRALSRAVGFELGQTEATIARNQEIANLETSTRLFGVVQERNARVARVGSGLTVGLNAAAGGIRAGANALEIRNRLSN